MNSIELQQNWEDDGLHEECGVFGMYDLDGNDVASSIAAQRTGKLWYFCIRHVWT